VAFRLFRFSFVFAIFFVVFIYVVPGGYAISNDGEIFSEAERKFYTGNYSGALESYETLIKKYPLSDLIPDAVYRKALCLLMLGRLNEARDNFFAVEKRYRNTAYIGYVPFWIGSIDYRSRRFEEAIEYFNQFLSQPGMEKEFVEKAYLYTAVSYFNLNQIDSAYRTIGSLVKIKKIENFDSEELIILLTILITSHNFDEAIHVYKRVEIERFPEDAQHRSLVLIAEAYLRKGLVRDAEKIYRSIIKTENREIASIVFSRLSTIYEKTGMYEEIIRLTGYADESLDLSSEVLKQLYLKSGVIGYRRGEIELSLNYLQRLWDYITSAGSIPERWLAEPTAIYLAEDYLKLNEKQKAIKVLRELLNYYPNSKYGTYRLNTIYILDGDFQRAVSVFKNYLKAFPEDNLARLYLSISLYKNGALEEAESEGSRVNIEKLPEDLKPDYFHLMALIMSKLGTPQVAAIYYQKYLELKPEDRRIFLDYLKVLFQSGKYEEVVSKTEGSVEVESGDPVEVQIGYLRGISLVMLKKYRDALSLLKDVIDKSNIESIGELSGYSLYYLGWCYFKLDNIEKAERIFDEFIEKYPTHPLYVSSLYLAAWSSYSLGNFSRSEMLFKELSGMKNRYKVAAIYLMAKSLINQRKYPEALPLLETLYKNYPDNDLSDDAMFDYATILDKTGKSKEAAEIYYRVYRKWPESRVSREALYKRAEIYFKMGDYENAARSFGEYASLFPRSELYDAAIYWEAQSLLKLSKEKEAGKLLEEIVKVFPKSSFRPDALIDLAEIHAGIGDYEKAIDLYSILLDEYPEYRDDTDIRVRIEELRYLEFGLPPDEAILTARMSVFRGTETKEGREAMLGIASLYLERGGKYLERAFELLGRVLQHEDRKTAARAQYLIGDYYSKKGDALAAARAYFRASLIYTADREFVARSLYKSAENMKKAGRQKEARDLLVKLIETFPDLEWADKAKKLLKEEP